MYAASLALSLPRQIARGVSAATLLAVLAAAPVSAHHSPARFDLTRRVTFTGVVTDVKWANPHVYLTVAQTTDDGGKIEWDVETVGPSALRRLGWTESSVRVGDQVSLMGSPARNGDHSLNLGSLQHGDRSLNVMALVQEYSRPGTPPAAGAATLDGTWAVLIKLALILPYLPGQTPPPLTDAGAAAAAAFDESTMLPALHCVQSPAPFFMFTPDVKRISSAGDEIRIVGDYEGAERVIHMNAAHEGAKPSVQGHSIGHWDGDTLVVDTTSFTPHATGHAFGVPSGTKKHLIERLTRNAEGTRIAYHFEVSDPEFLKAPITGDAEWAYRPDLELSPQTCDPEVAQRFTRKPPR